MEKVMHVNQEKIAWMKNCDTAFLGLDHQKAILELTFNSNDPEQNESSVRLHVDFSCKIYSKDMLLDPKTRAGFLIYVNEGNEWATFVHALQPGDRAVAHFQLMNASPAMEEAGFVEDSLIMKIIRDQGVSKPPLILSFKVDNRITRKSDFCVKSAPDAA
jgi:hypothetical protein